MVLRDQKVEVAGTTSLSDHPQSPFNQAVRRGEGVREVRACDAGAAGDAVQAAGRLHRAHPQEGPVEDPLQVGYCNNYCG